MKKSKTVAILPLLAVCLTSWPASGQTDGHEQPSDESMLVILANPERIIQHRVRLVGYFVLGENSGLYLTKEAHEKVLPGLGIRVLPKTLEREQFLAVSGRWVMLEGTLERQFDKRYPLVLKEPVIVYRNWPDPDSNVNGRAGNRGDR
jgi:hypothetical protein